MIRQQPTQVIENLFIGPFNSSRDLNILECLNISHIVNCTTLPSNHLSITYLNIPFDDNCVDIQHIIPQAIQFIDEHITNNKSIMVFCKFGASRSATIVVAYLMFKYNWKYKQALNYLKSVRTICCPNHYFKQQLKTFDFAKLKGEKEGEKNEN